MTSDGYVVDFEESVVDYSWSIKGIVSQADYVHVTSRGVGVERSRDQYAALGCFFACVLNGHHRGSPDHPASLNFTGKFLFCHVYSNSRQRVFNAQIDILHNFRDLSIILMVSHHVACSAHDVSFLTDINCPHSRHRNGGFPPTLTQSAPLSFDSL